MHGRNPLEPPVGRWFVLVFMGVHLFQPVPICADSVHFHLLQSVCYHFFGLYMKGVDFTTGHKLEIPGEKARGPPKPHGADSSPDKTSPALAPLSPFLPFWGPLCFPLARQKISFFAGVRIPAEKTRGRSASRSRRCCSRRSSARRPWRRAPEFFVGSRPTPRCLARVLREPHGRHRETKGHPHASQHLFFCLFCCVFCLGGPLKKDTLRYCIKNI